MISLARRRWLLSLAALLVSIGWAQALINPKYTPVNLVKDAKVILQLELGTPSDTGAITAKVTTTLKGQPPAKLDFTIDREDVALLESLTKARGDKQNVSALYFAGDSFEGAVDGGGEEASQTAALCVGDTWFSLASEGGTFLLSEDALDLRAVWSGGADSLTKITTLILADPKADVPVAGDVTWRDSVHLVSEGSPISGSLPVQFTGSESPGLLLLSEKGDRFFQWNATDKKFEDLTAKLKLVSHSRFAAAADFDADGRVDLVSSDEGKMRFQVMTEAGDLKTIEVPAWSGDCLALTICATATQRSGAIATTSGWPVLVSLGADGAASSQAVGTGDFPTEKWGKAHSCLVADYDGDGLEDIVQPCDKGILFYKGEAPGKWLAPTLACEIKLGEAAVSVSSGDFDGDGLLDVIMGGEKAWNLLLNRGKGLFTDTTSGTGEANYSAQGKMSGVFNCDLNSDGREEFVFLRSTLAPTAFFNRGFACFGFCEELDFKNTEGLAAADPLGSGQSSGFAADFNGDGVQEFLMVSAKGEAWVLFCKPTATGRVGLTVAAPPGQAGSLVVTARDGKRELGARVVTPAVPAFFGKREKGPLQLTWTHPGSTSQSKSVTVIKPTRLVLTPGGSPP